MAFPEFIYLKPPHGFLDGKDWNKYLGAIVKNCWNPSRDWIPDPVIQLQPYDLTEKTYDHFMLRTQISQRKTTKGNVERLFKLQSDARSLDDLNLKGKRLRSKRIVQHDRMWARVIKRPKVQETALKWITESNPNPIGQRSVWWITGVLIAQETEQVTSRWRTALRKAKLEAPLGTAATIAANVQGLPISLDGVGDISVAQTEQKDKTTYFYSKSSRPQIIALEVRRVDRRGREVVLVPGQPKTS